VDVQPAQHLEETHQFTTIVSPKKMTQDCERGITLGTVMMGFTIDARGRISDNAGGVAEMPGIPEMVLALTDCLDVAGNTTAAIGRGFAFASAALVSLALLGAFTVQARASNEDILNPWAFMAPLFGATTLYAYSAWAMGSPGVAWDNSNKHVSAGGLGEEFVKGSEAHRNSMTGDTVGDALKEVVKGSEAHKTQCRAKPRRPAEGHRGPSAIHPRRVHRMDAGTTDSNADSGILEWG